MKKYIQTALLIAGVALTTSQAFAASDGQVKFTGTILDAACTIDGATGGVINVDMGKVVKTALAAAAGNTTDPTAFTISLKDCAAALTTASIKFDGTALGGNNTIIALTDGDVENPAAEGVGVQISDSTGTVMPLYTESTPFTLDSTAGVVNKLNFTARFISTNTDVVAGVANAAVNFTVVYN